jgi:hypothetical protein
MSDTNIPEIVVDDYSLASYYLVMKFDDLVLSSGTCFFYEWNQQVYLVTNWHNVSGKNPETKQCLSPTGAIPNKLSVRLMENKPYVEWGTYEINLFNEDGHQIWLEHKEFGQNVDVVVLPVNIPKKFIIYPINNLEEPFNEDTNAIMGQDVFVLGFPFGITGGGLPIWKRASIASEPGFNIDELPKMYVDTASRSGMSGSPVIIKEKRPITLMSNDIFSRYLTKLVGVYSGRIGAKDEFQAQLGIVWKSKIIEEIIEKNRIN